MAIRKSWAVTFEGLCPSSSPRARLSRKLKSLALALVAFAALEGCAGKTAPPAASPSMANDPAFAPPGEDFAFAPKDTPPTGTKTSTAACSMRPNREQIPQRGQVHAATN